MALTSLLITILIAVIVLAVILYIVNLLGSIIPIDGRIIKAIHIIIVLIFLIWLIQRLSLIAGLGIG